MGQLITAPLRTNVDATPNQIVTNADPTQSIGLMLVTVYNPNASDGWLRFYQESSGSVNVGSTTEQLPPVLVPAGSQVIIGSDNASDPLQFFTTAVTVAFTATSTGSTSLALDAQVGIKYWR